MTVHSQKNEFQFQVGLHHMKTFSPWAYYTQGGINGINTNITYNRILGKTRFTIGVDYSFGITTIDIEETQNHIQRINQNHLVRPGLVCGPNADHTDFYEDKISTNTLLMKVGKKFGNGRIGFHPEIGFGAVYFQSPKRTNTPVDGGANPFNNGQSFNLDNTFLTTAAAFQQHFIWKLNEQTGLMFTPNLDAIYMRSGYDDESRFQMNSPVLDKRWRLSYGAKAGISYLF